MPRVSVGKVADLPQGKLVGAEIDGEKIFGHPTCRASFTQLPDAHLDPSPA